MAAFWHHTGITWPEESFRNCCEVAGIAIISLLARVHSCKCHHTRVIDRSWHGLTGSDEKYDCDGNEADRRKESKMGWGKVRQREERNGERKWKIICVCVWVFFQGFQPHSIETWTWNINITTYTQTLTLVLKLNIRLCTLLYLAHENTHTHNVLIKSKNQTCSPKKKPSR